MSKHLQFTLEHLCARTSIEALYGCAISKIRFADKKWWAVSRDEEYASSIQFCPFCGMGLTGLELLL